MNRIIQFRCFYRGVMYPVKEMQFDTDGSFSVSIIEMDLDDLGIRDVSPDSEHIKGIMQYTGLKDRNGTPIFEGDLIKSINITMYGGVREIKWHDQICAWVGKWELVKPILLYDFVNPEVIGNIYEHKHLLK